MPDSDRRTAAIVITSVGALLLATAAATFISIAWEFLTLPGKTVVVGAATIAVLAVGKRLRGSLPGVASVMTHLGALLVPLDVGASAVLLGAGKPLTSLCGGIAGLAVFEIVDRDRSRFLALGRALAAAAIGLGIAGLLGTPPALIMFVLAVAGFALRRKSEAIVVGTLAGLSPAVETLATWFAEPGSLLDWLAKLSTVDPLATSGFALVSIAFVLALGAGRSRWIIASVLAAVNAPTFLSLVADNPVTTILVVATSTVVIRVSELVFNLKRSAMIFDAWTFVASSCVLVFGLNQFAESGDLNASGLVAGLALIMSWLIADAGGDDADGHGLVGRLWHGSVGPITTIGLALGTVATMLAAGGEIAAGSIAVGFASIVGTSERRGAAPSMLAALLVAGGLFWTQPLWLPIAIVATIVLIHVRVVLDLRAGAAPADARSFQTAGMLLGALSTVIYIAGSAPSVWGVSAILLAGAITSVAIVRMTSVPDVVDAPRWFMLLPLLAFPLGGTALGILALLVGMFLIVDGAFHRLPVSEAIGAIVAMLGSWALAGDQGVTVLEAYVAVPAVLLTGFGYRTVRGGGNSWSSLAPAVFLPALAGLTERVSDGSGWHSVSVGAIAVFALVIGIANKWAGPSVVGLVTLLAVVGLESAAFAPVVPLWIWLAVGGVVLVGAGAWLERRVSDAGTAPLKAAWAEFV